MKIKFFYFYYVNHKFFIYLLTIFITIYIKIILLCNIISKFKFLKIWLFLIENKILHFYFFLIYFYLKYNINICIILFKNEIKILKNQ